MPNHCRSADGWSPAQIHAKGFFSSSQSLFTIQWWRIANGHEESTPEGWRGRFYSGILWGDGSSHKAEDSLEGKERVRKQQVTSTVWFNTRQVEMTKRIKSTHICFSILPPIGGKPFWPMQQFISLGPVLKWAYGETWVQTHNPLQLGSHRIISLLLHLFTKLCLVFHLFWAKVCLLYKNPMQSVDLKKITVGDRPVLLSENLGKQKQSSIIFRQWNNALLHVMLYVILMLKADQNWWSEP